MSLHREHIITIILLASALGVGCGSTETAPDSPAPSLSVTGTTDTGTITNSNAQARFRRLTWTTTGGSVVVGDTTLRFTFEADGSVTFDDTVCHNEYDLLRVLQRRTIQVPKAEVRSVAQALNSDRSRFPADRLVVLLRLLDLVLAPDGNNVGTGT